MLDDYRIASLNGKSFGMEVNNPGSIPDLAIFFYQLEIFSSLYISFILLGIKHRNVLYKGFCRIHLTGTKQVYDYSLKLQMLVAICLA